MPKLILYRKSSLFGFIRAYKITIDGNEMGFIKNSETKTIELTAGIHTLQIKAGGIKTEAIECEITSDKSFVLDTDKTIYGLVVFFLTLGFIGLNYTLDNFPAKDYLKWIMLLGTYLLIITSMPSIGGKHIFKIEEAD